MRRFTTVLVVAGFVLLVVPMLVSADATSDKKAQLQSALTQVEQQIVQQQVLVQNKQKERQSLERDISIINSEIKQAQLGIEARSMAISQLSSQIDDKEAALTVLSDRLSKQQATLAEAMRQARAYDDFSLAEVMLSNKNLSDFFSDADRFHAVKSSLNSSLEALHAIKTDTEAQKNSLEEKQLQEAEMKRVQELQKQDIQSNEAEKQKILTTTKGQEAAYQQMLRTSQKTAAQLRAALFALLGGGGSIPFPVAVQYAQTAEAITGTPAALTLAILEQESYYGKNIGSCTMGDVSSGKDIMNPTRDKPVFLAIAATLGFNPATQQVSCPLRRSNGTRIGWGGAMGASQFIPSTWAIYGGYDEVGGVWKYIPSQDAIRVLLKKDGPSNPFNNQDAFVATALLLRDNGAKGTYYSDRLAALRYYAGWGGANNPENAFYGDGVMKRMARLEGEIQTLNGG